MEERTDTPRAPGNHGPRVAELRKGHKVSGAVYLVEVSNFKQTRNQKYFIQLSLRDRTGSIKAIRWEASEEEYQSFQPDDFLRVSGRVEEYQGQLQLIVDQFRKVPPQSVDARDFLPATTRDVTAMERELAGAVASLENEHLRRLLESILGDAWIRDALRRCPAGKAVHHAYIGGLLEHVVALVSAARAVASLYPQLNRDVLIASAVIHDIGKLQELSYTKSFTYTSEGQLLGHIALGLLLVSEKARKLPDFPPDLLLQLQHIIVSHHGLPEHGALKPPMTPEAVAFHYLDNLDAKLGTLSEIARALPPQEGEEDREGRWSDFKPHLGRKLFFPRQENGEGPPP